MIKVTIHYCISKHGADVRDAGHVFVPVVWETFGTLGPKGKAYFDRCIGEAEIAPEWGEELSEAQVRARRAALSARWQQRFSTTLQRGNARCIITRARASRTLAGVRVHGQWGQSELDVGLGAEDY